MNNMWNTHFLWFHFQSLLCFLFDTLTCFCF